MGEKRHEIHHGIGRRYPARARRSAGRGTAVSHAADPARGSVRTTNEALADASVRTRLEQIGYSVAGGSPPTSPRRSGSVVRLALRQRSVLNVAAPDFLWPCYVRSQDNVHCVTTENT
jgi:hypothetical protein